MTDCATDKTGKTVAPKAVARRRPAASRPTAPPPKKNDETLPTEEPGPSTSEANDTVDGPATVPAATPPTDRRKSPQIAQPADSQPEPQPGKAGTEQATIQQPSPPPTQQVTSGHPVLTESPSTRPTPPQAHDVPAIQPAPPQKQSSSTQPSPPAETHALTPLPQAPNDIHQRVTSDDQQDAEAVVAAQDEAAQASNSSVVPAGVDPSEETIEPSTVGRQQEPSTSEDVLRTTSDDGTPIVEKPGIPSVTGSRSQPQPTAGVKRKRAEANKAGPRKALDRNKEIQQSVEATSQPEQDNQQPVEDRSQVTDAQTSAAQAEIGEKAKRKRQTKTSTSQVADTTGVDDGSTTKAAKPRRKPKAKQKPLSAARVAEDDDGTAAPETGGDEGEAMEGVETTVKPPKPKKERRRKATTTEPPAEGQEEEIEDPELHEIDVTATTLSDLVRDRPLGKTSEREAKMSTIDWTEVARKRREMDTTLTATDGAEPSSNNGDRDEEQQRSKSPQVASRRTGPQLRIVNGEIVVDEASLHVDRQARAAANAANLQVTEDGDLTKRVNRLTYINDKKRDPADRVTVYKMKSDPWHDDETERFYDALRMFGTDFYIISKMFPPKTRRQIKLKFVREEKLFPDRINAALAGEGVPMDLSVYAEATGMDVNEFKDPRELDEELRQEGEEQRGEIELKRKETAETKQQRDIQMAAREKDREAREAQKQTQKEERAAIRARKRRGQYGTGAF